MKLVNIDHPIRASWLTDQASRLDPAPYLSGAYEARKLLENLRVRKDSLAALTSGHEGGIFNGPKFRRLYVQDLRYGVPFLGSTDMLEADLSWLPRLQRSYAENLPYLEVEPGMTLISCSGTVGRTTYVRPDMTGIWSSQHVMKVNPDRGLIHPGYLYTFLRSRFGVPVIASAAYGAIVQHIEPHHLANLPVPRFDETIEQEIHDLIERAVQLRADFQAGVVAATHDLFESAGLSELADPRWYERPRDLGFSVPGVGPTTLRALNFSPRARGILDALRSVPHRRLGDVCAGGQLERGTRFKRIDSDPKHGVQLLGQRQAFWIHPEGRWVSISSAQDAGSYVPREVVLVASRGTLGENEVYCRPILTLGGLESYAYTEDFLRISPPHDSDFPGAYIFAFLRSEAGFRILRSMSVGSKQQDIHPALRRQIPVPECTAADRARIAETVRRAYRYRYEAGACEDEALRLLDVAVREAAG